MGHQHFHLSRSPPPPENRFFKGEGLEKLDSGPSPGEYVPTRSVFPFLWHVNALPTTGEISSEGRGIHQTFPTDVSARTPADVYASLSTFFARVFFPPSPSLSSFLSLVFFIGKKIRTMSKQVEITVIVARVRHEVGIIHNRFHLVTYSENWKARFFQIFFFLHRVVLVCNSSACKRDMYLFERLTIHR